jgi:hypothetical protein
MVSVYRRCDGTMYMRPASPQRGGSIGSRSKEGSPRRDGLGVLERFVSLKNAGKAAMRQRSWT